MQANLDSFKKLCGAAFCAVAFLCVGNANALTVEEAVSSALKRHPSVATAKAFIDAADKQVEIERSSYFPEISASLSGGRIYGDNATSRGLSVTRGAGYSGFWEGRTSLVQPIFNGFKTQELIAGARASAKSAGMQIFDVREELALRTVQAYLDVMRTHAALHMIRNHIVITDDYLERIESSVSEGVIDEAQFYQAADVKHILQGFVSEYEAQAISAEARFTEATGYVPEGDLRIPDRNFSSLIDPDVNGIIDDIVQDHPSVRALSYQEKAVSHSIKGEEAGLYPALSSELSFLKSGKDDILGGEVVDARALLRMNWSFETGGALNGRVEKRIYELQEIKSRKRETINRLESDIRQSYAGMLGAQRRLDHVQDRLRLNENLQKTLQTQFEAARVSLLELMQADNQVFNLKLEKLNAEYGMMASQYSVLASMGVLEPHVTIVAQAIP